MSAETRVKLSVRCRMGSGPDALDAAPEGAEVVVRMRGSSASGQGVLWTDACRVLLHGASENVLPFTFEARQYLRFTLVAPPDAALRLTGQAAKPTTLPTASAMAVEDMVVLGEARTTLGRIMGARGQVWLQLYAPGRVPVARLRVRGRELAVPVPPPLHVLPARQSSQHVTLSLSLSDLPKMDLFGRCDPYIVLCRQGADGALVRVAETPVMRRTYEATFPPLEVSLQELCDSDWRRPFVLEVFDWDRNSSDDFVGRCVLTMDDLMRSAFPLPSARRVRDEAYGPDGRYVRTHTTEVIRATMESSQGALRWPLSSEAPAGLGGAWGKLLKSSKRHGVLTVDWSEVAMLSTTEPDTAAADKRVREASAEKFLRFVAGGCQLSLMVAIDFTGSNGPSQLPTSLHYVQAGQPNCYQACVRAIGFVLQDYCPDRRFPVLQFGGRVQDASPGLDTYCFPLTFDPSRPCVRGVEGVLDAYERSLSRMRLYGPTSLVPVLQRAVAWTRGEAVGLDRQRYHVLLLLTDGAICDPEAALTLLDDVAALPLSVLVVGIGDADFTAMHTLVATSQARMRSVIQFVAFNEVRPRTAEQVARELLADLPSQVVRYFDTIGRFPDSRPVTPAPEADTAPSPPHSDDETDKDGSREEEARR